MAHPPIKRGAQMLSSSFFEQLDGFGGGEVVGKLHFHEKLFDFAGGGEDKPSPCPFQIVFYGEEKSDERGVHRLRIGKIEEIEVKAVGNT